MNVLPVSVIVVSRHRPVALRRCLIGISQLFHQNFEVIVVADAVGLVEIESLGFENKVKAVEFDQFNISIARNLGLECAAGQIVAFIDDDAVPEPTWLDHLIEPFQDASVDAAGGYVRGRNGITFQSTAQSVNALDQHTPLRMNGDEPHVFDGSAEQAIKTEGTNCAFRRDTLMNMGGFDPLYRFYLDETDVNIRLGMRSAKTAIVPMAEVHHGFAASNQRTHCRMPRTLFDVGSSFAVFLRKYAPEDQIETALVAFRSEQQDRLVRHLIAGNCEPFDVPRIMKSLDDGIETGRDLEIRVLPPLSKTTTSFLRFETTPNDGSAVCLAGRIWSRSSMKSQAGNLVKKGQRVSVFLFSPTSLYHRVEFLEPGYWLQTGGVFGRSTRTSSVLKLLSFNRRVVIEKSRVRFLRGFNI